MDLKAFSYRLPVPAKGDAIRIAVIVVSTLTISALHYLTPASEVHWQYILPRFFYFPVVYAGLYFGWKGGLAAAVFAGLNYIPHIGMPWRQIPNYEIDQYLEVLVFCSAGVLTGILADRERAQKNAYQRAVHQLSRVYGELQKNFEGMKRAERLYAVGQLSAGLAHEIRNPLASIAGAVGILKRNPRSGQRQMECLDIIDKECRRLNRLLTSFLDFAKPRRPRYHVISTEPALDAVISLAGHAVDRKPIRLRKAIAPALPDFECDPEQLEQVLLNLIINAIQASPEGGEVVLAAHVDDGKIVMQVKDRGCGVSEEHIDKLFDPFFTTKEDGTGLGLSVAHQIVRQLGGILTAERNPDQGMCFSVILPLRRES